MIICGRFYACVNNCVGKLCHHQIEQQRPTMSMRESTDTPRIARPFSIQRRPWHCPRSTMKFSSGCSLWHLPSNSPNASRSLHRPPPFRITPFSPCRAGFAALRMRLEISCFLGCRIFMVAALLSPSASLICSTLYAVVQLLDIDLVSWVTPGARNLPEIYFRKPLLSTENPLLPSAESYWG